MVLTYNVEIIVLHYHIRYRETQKESENGEGEEKELYIEGVGNWNRRGKSTGSVKSLLLLGGAILIGAPAPK